MVILVNIKQSVPISSMLLKHFKLTCAQVRFSDHFLCCKHLSCFMGSLLKKHWARKAKTLYEILYHMKQHCNVQLCIVIHFIIHYDIYMKYDKILYHMILYDILSNHTTISNIVIRIINYDFYSGLLKVMPRLVELCNL